MCETAVRYHPHLLRSDWFWSESVHRTFWKQKPDELLRRFFLSGTAVFAWLVVSDTQTVRHMHSAFIPQSPSGISHEQPGCSTNLTIKHVRPTYTRAYMLLTTETKKLNFTRKHISNLSDDEKGTVTEIIIFKMLPNMNVLRSTHLINRRVELTDCSSQ